MQRFTFGLATIAVNLVFCLTFPLETILSNASDIIPLTMGESVVTAQLSLIHNTESFKESKGEDVKSRKPTKDDTKIERDAEEVDNDYAYLADKIPDDEYQEIGEYSTPINNINNRNKEDVVKVQPRPITIASANPIYITIPIYINTTGGLPLTLSVGGRQVPLKSNPSPTSQFNRLLNNDDTQKNDASQQANHQRSNFHSKIYANSISPSI